MVRKYQRVTKFSSKETGLKAGQGRREGILVCSWFEICVVLRPFSMICLWVISSTSINVISTHRLQTFRSPFPAQLSLLSSRSIHLRVYWTFPQRSPTVSSNKKQVYSCKFVKHSFFFLFINYCIIFHENNCKPTFVPRGTKGSKLNLMVSTSSFSPPPPLLYPHHRVWHIPDIFLAGKHTSSQSTSPVLIFSKCVFL